MPLPPRIVKIDTEGSESEILSHLRKLNELLPADEFIVEINPELIGLEKANAIIRRFEGLNNSFQIVPYELEFYLTKGIKIIDFRTFGSVGKSSRRFIHQKTFGGNLSLNSLRGIKSFPSCWSSRFFLEPLWPSSMMGASIRRLTDPNQETFTSRGIERHFFPIAHLLSEKGFSSIWANVGFCTFGMLPERPRSEYHLFEANSHLVSLLKIHWAKQLSQDFRQTWLPEQSSWS